MRAISFDGRFFRTAAKAALNHADTILKPRAAKRHCRMSALSKASLEERFTSQFSSLANLMEFSS